MEVNLTEELVNSGLFFGVERGVESNFELDINRSYLDFGLFAGWTQVILKLIAFIVKIIVFSTIILRFLKINSHIYRIQGNLVNSGPHRRKIYLLYLMSSSCVHIFQILIRWQFNESGGGICASWENSDHMIIS